MAQLLSRRLAVPFTRHVASLSVSASATRRSLSSEPLSNDKPSHWSARKPTWLSSEKVNPAIWEKQIAGNSHGFPEWIEAWGKRPFFLVGTTVMIPAAVGSMALLGPTSLLAWAITVPAAGYWAIGLRDLNQTSHTIRRNFPVLGNLRYFFETIRPEIRQYFVESDSESSPFSRNHRSTIYSRAKNMQDSMPFGTRRDVYADGYEWINHSIWPTDVLDENTRVTVGGPQCSKPYSAALLNISGMSYGSLSDNAILALNSAAKLGNFYHNTGEGAVSRFHKAPGGDIVWNIGTAYFGCRDPDGNFSVEHFKENALLPQVRMIELKLSQGAKPGHGGILPKSKVTPAIAEARGLVLENIKGDVVSPPRHTAFSTAKEMMHFLQLLRDESGGKPVGFKLCVGRPDEFSTLAMAMLDTGVYPDFITVDGGEGGTGAAPPEFSNSVGMPLNEGLTIVHNVLRGVGLRDKIKIIASGKVSSGFSVVRNLALGADMCNAARAMMIALGCIQALKCNTNQCPTGIATQDPVLMEGLAVDQKAVRVKRYQAKTVNAALEIVGAVGLKDPNKLLPEHVFKRINQRDVVNFGSVFPEIPMGCLLDEDYLSNQEKVMENRTLARLLPFWRSGQKLYERKE